MAWSQKHFLYWWSAPNQCSHQTAASVVQATVLKGFVWGTLNSTLSAPYFDCKQMSSSEGSGSCGFLAVSSLWIVWSLSTVQSRDFSKHFARKSRKARVVLEKKQLIKANTNQKKNFRCNLQQRILLFKFNRIFNVDCPLYVPDIGLSLTRRILVLWSELHFEGWTETQWNSFQREKNSLLQTLVSSLNLLQLEIPRRKAPTKNISIYKWNTSGRGSLPLYK